MSDGLVGRAAQWGWGIETTVGTAVAATLGVPNTNKTPIDPGQAWVEDSRATGLTVLNTLEVIDDTINPVWSPETTLWHPEFGEWMSMLFQKASETGTGPYVQSMEPDLTSGKTLDHGATAALGGRSGTVWQRVGQTTSRDVAMTGAVLSRIDVTIPESGRVKVTPSFMGFGYSDSSDGSGGTYTLPAVTSEKMARDFVFKLGDGTPSALYAKEITISFIAELVAHRYGGMNDAYPYRFVYAGWTVEGSFSKPVLAATNTLARDYLVGGGDVGKDQLLYVYSKTMSDYNEAASTLSDGEMRFTLNVKLDGAIPAFDDEVVENINFKGAYDGTNNIAKFEQCTTASQAWAS